MDDRQLLELAAKAAGINIIRCRLEDIFCNDMLVEDSELNRGQFAGSWNPLTDDGDALRLAVKLNLHITSSLSTAWVSHMQVTETEPMGEDPYAATRRAIVRAAASLGKGLVQEKKNG